MVKLELEGGVVQTIPVDSVEKHKSHDDFFGEIFFLESDEDEDWPHEILMPATVSIPNAIVAMPALDVNRQHPNQCQVYKL